MSPTFCKTSVAHNNQLVTKKKIYQIKLHILSFLMVYVVFMYYYYNYYIFQLNIKFQIFRKSQKWQYFFFVVVVNLHAIKGFDTLIADFYTKLSRKRTGTCPAVCTHCRFLFHSFSEQSPERAHALVYII